jgi:hypothetical protein
MRLFSGNSCHLFCVSIVLLPGQSYIALFNALQFLVDLKNNTMARFNQMVSGAFLLSIVFFVFVMSVGFSTLAGFVLNNYASSDPLAPHWLASPSAWLCCFPPHPLLIHALLHSTLPLLCFCVSSCLGGTGRLPRGRSR